jgi:hypothetical protein
MAASTVTRITTTLRDLIDTEGCVLAGRMGSLAALSTDKLGTILYNLQSTVNTNAAGLDAVVTSPGVKNIPLDTCKLQTLLQLAATASTNVFGLAAGTYGSAAPYLIGEATSNGTKTDYTRFLVALPPDYKAAGTAVITIHAKYSAGVSGAHTMDFEAFLSDKEKGAGADLCATTIATLTTSYADYAFTVTGTTLNPGDILDCRITGVLTDTGSGAVIEIGDIRLTYQRTGS